VCTIANILPVAARQVPDIMRVRGTHPYAQLVFSVLKMQVVIAAATLDYTKCRVECVL
jgi:hypothetical protein